VLLLLIARPVGANNPCCAPIPGVLVSGAGLGLIEALQVSGWPLTRSPATVETLPPVSTLRTQLFCVSEM
jgi:hypothetical protein